MATEQGNQHEQKSEMGLLKCGSTGKDWVKFCENESRMALSLRMNEVAEHEMRWQKSKMMNEF